MKQQSKLEKVMWSLLDLIPKTQHENATNILDYLSLAFKGQELYEYTVEFIDIQGIRQVKDGTIAVAVTLDPTWELEARLIGSYKIQKFLTISYAKVGSEWKTARYNR